MLKCAALDGANQTAVQFSALFIHFLKFSFTVYVHKSCHVNYTRAIMNHVEIIHLQKKLSTTAIYGG